MNVAIVINEEKLAYGLVVNLLTFLVIVSLVVMSKLYSVYNNCYKFKKLFVGIAMITLSATILFLTLVLICGVYYLFTTL